MKSTFETLEAWKKASELRKELSEMVRSFPSEEKFRLSDQILRASRSVTANLAEGHGRYHFQGNFQFCRQARGSLYELIDHVTIALDENYISEEKFENLKDTTIQTIKIINGYITYLKNQKNSYHSTNSTNSPYSTYSTNPTKHK